jgi:hypothetical protein
MSAKILGLVLEHWPSDDHTSLAIAIVLADAADPDGSNVRPAVDRIAALSRTSERTVQTHLKRMQEVGFLHKDREACGHIPRIYSIDVKWLQSHPSLIDKLTVARVSKRGATNAPHFPPPQQLHFADQKRGATGVKQGCNRGAAVAAPYPQPTTLDPKNYNNNVVSELIFPKLDPRLLPDLRELLTGQSNAQDILDELAAGLEKNPPIAMPAAWVAAVIKKGLVRSTAGLKKTDNRLALIASRQIDIQPAKAIFEGDDNEALCIGGILERLNKKSSNTNK